MAKLPRYVPIEEKRQELLEVLYTKAGLPKGKARQLIIYGVPMSLIRWAKYLTVTELPVYLREVTEEDTKNDLGI